MKLYVVGRNDLNNPYKHVQTMHAAIQFQHEHPIESKDWYENSNYLVYLTVETEEDLFKLLNKAESLGIKCSTFFEPDLDNQLTAIALEPSLDSKRITSSLKLMGKGVYHAV